MPASTRENLDQVAAVLESTTATHIMNSLLPNVVVAAWYRWFHGEVSLTTPAQIESFNLLHEELAHFCVPSEPLSIHPDIATCWRVFRHEKVNARTYCFSYLVEFEALNRDYQQRKTTGGKTYWDSPLTSAILDILMTAESLDIQAKQSLCKIVFSYIASVALIIAGFESDVEKYNGAIHLRQVIHILLTNERCRRVLNVNNTEVLVRLSNRVTEFFAEPHLMQDAEFIPKAIAAFALLQRELASQWFSILLSMTEGADKEHLSRDYQRIARGLITSDEKSVYFNPENPFQTLLKAAALWLMALNDESDELNNVDALYLPELALIQTYVQSNLEKVSSKIPHWLGGSSGTLLYFFLQSVDVNTGCVSQTALEDKTAVREAASYLSQCGYWLKFHLDMAEHARTLRILHNMEGQRFIARGAEASFIQGFIHQHHSLLVHFEADIAQLTTYLQGRVRAKMGFEQNILKRLETVTVTKRKLDEKGIIPLLNIDAKYTVIAAPMHVRRQEFFRRIRTMLNQANYGFSLPAVEATVVIGSVHALPPTSKETTMPSPIVDMPLYAQHKVADYFLRWIKIYKNDIRQREHFLRFWEKLLYVLPDQGLMPSAALKKWKQFHRASLAPQHLVASQHDFLSQVKQALTESGAEVRQWASDTVERIFKPDSTSKNSPEQLLSEKLHLFSEQLKRYQQYSQSFLQEKLGVQNEIAWDPETYKELNTYLVNRLHMPQDDAYYFLREVAARLLQTNIDKPDSLSRPLDVLLTAILRQLQEDATSKKYWSTLSRGLMMLGASPLLWMDMVMEQSVKITEESSHGFYVAAEQAFVLISSLYYRASFLGESHFYLQERWEKLFLAMEAFGERLYECVADDESWWWRLASIFLPNKGGARLERAQLYGAICCFVGHVLNDQLKLANESADWTAVMQETLRKMHEANLQYKQAVPMMKKFYNQGFSSWQRLTEALEAVLMGLDTLALMRRNYALAQDKDQASKLSDETMFGLQQKLVDTEARAKRLQVAMLVEKMRDLLPKSTDEIEVRRLRCAIQAIAESLAPILQVEKDAIETDVMRMIRSEVEWSHLRSFLNNNTPVSLLGRGKTMFYPKPIQPGTVSQRLQMV